MPKVENSVVLVSGANRGIGKAFVEEALNLGASKVYACSRKIMDASSFAEEHRNKVVCLELDVTKDDQIQKVAEAAGDVNLLINNAGVAAYSGYSVNYKPDEAINEMAVNYYGMLNMSLAFILALKKNGNGSILNVVSVGGLQSFPFAATYCASKAAAHSLTQSLREELREEGIFVAGIYPGPVDTDMAASVDMEKETPNQVALNSYEAMQKGAETILPDKFAVDFAQSLSVTS